MEQIPTAEEFLKSKGCNYILQKGKLYFSDVTREDMIEFAKLHVEAALYVASERADLTDNGRFPYVDKDSILNSYSLDNVL